MKKLFISFATKMFSKHYQGALLLLFTMLVFTILILTLDLFGIINLI